MNKQRVPIKIVPSLPDKILDVSSGLMLALILGVLIITYVDLPEIIPIHYNARGQIDAYGSKSNIVVFPLITLILYILMTVLIRYPHTLSYPGEITVDNALKNYTVATRLLRVVKFLMVASCGYVVSKTVFFVEETFIEVGGYFVPIYLGFAFLLLVYYSIATNRKTS